MNLLHTASDIQQDLILETIELVARVFWKPDKTLARTIWDGGLNDYFNALGEQLSPQFALPAQAIKSTIKSTASFTDFFQELESVYVRLFVNAKAGIAVPLYQSCYVAGAGTLMGQPAIYMNERLQTHGIELNVADGEPPDHLAIELEYVSILLGKGWQTKDRNLIEDTGRFTGQMLVPWTRQFTERLIAAYNPSIYLPIAELLQILLPIIRLPGPSTAR